MMRKFKNRFSFLVYSSFSLSRLGHARRTRCNAVIFLSAFFLLGLFSGCEPKEKAAPAPKMVTQKILPEETASPEKDQGKTETQEAVMPQKADAEPSSGEPAVDAEKKEGEELMLARGYNYDPKGKIDPFEPLFREAPAAATQKKKVREGPLTPLERVDLSQLKLTGVILAQSGNKALIKEASGKGYIVKVGTRIGINSGQIVQILKDRIIVEEEFEDVMGKVSVQTKEMTLQKPAGD